MKSSVGSRIVERLKGFTEALESNHVISERFTCHKVHLDLKPTRYSPELVKRTRKLLGVSQALFARFIGTSPQTIRAWEQGINVPNDMACRFMDEIRQEPAYWLARLRKLVVSKTTEKTSGGTGALRKSAAR